MAAPIHIPADITVVSLAGQPQRWTEDYAKKVLSAASDLLSSRAQIEFYADQFETVSETMPSGMSSDAVDDEGYFFLSNAHRARGGVRVLLVDRLAKQEVGGESVAKYRVCLLSYRASVGEASRMLAHELGHLLDLGHVDRPQGGPGHEKEDLASTQNLMSAGSLNPAALLTPAQVKQARSSALARRFGGG